MIPLTRKEVEAWPTLGPVALERLRVLELFRRIERLEAAPKRPAPSRAVVQRATEALLLLTEVVVMATANKGSIGPLTLARCVALLSVMGKPAEGGG